MKRQDDGRQHILESLRPLRRCPDCIVRDHRRPRRAGMDATGNGNVVGVDRDQIAVCAATDERCRDAARYERGEHFIALLG